MADEKKEKLHPPQWLGKPILAHEHVQDLETRAAINEFHHKMPRGQAEQAAHDSYVKENRERAAAHHLAGMKAAVATGNHQDGRKHWAMYDLHLKALGKESIGAVPPEIEKRMMEEHGDKPIYKFKAHKGDLYALHESSKDVAPAEGTPIAKSEVGQCKWKLGERRCQRKVTGQYCHDHVDHWANKIKQKEAPMEKAGELPKPAAPAPVAAAPKPAAPALAAPKPAAAPPAGTAHLAAPPAPAAAPQLHGTVQGFTQAFAALPKGSPARAKLASDHANHAPLAQAFHAAGMGAQWSGIAKLGAQFANSRANATVAGAGAKVVAKAETRQTARDLLKSLLDLAKGTLLKFPGNKTPAVDQGAAAPVIGKIGGVGAEMAKPAPAPAPRDPSDYSHLVPQGVGAKLRVTPHPEGGHLAELTDPKGLVLGSLHGKPTGRMIDRGYWGVKDPEITWKNMVPAKHRQAVPWMQMAIHQARGSED
jgi:hypothetical protein